MHSRTHLRHSKAPKCVSVANGYDPQPVAGRPDLHLPKVLLTSLCFQWSPFILSSQIAFGSQQPQFRSARTSSGVIGHSTRVEEVFEPHSLVTFGRISCSLHVSRGLLRSNVNQRHSRADTLVVESHYSGPVSRAACLDTPDRTERAHNTFPRCELSDFIRSDLSRMRYGSDVRPIMFSASFVDGTRYRRGASMANASSTATTEIAKATIQKGSSFKQVEIK